MCHWEREEKYFIHLLTLYHAQCFLSKPSSNRVTHDGATDNIVGYFVIMKILVKIKEKELHPAM
ncbi:hypothetical protein D3C78_1016920 [compost metagenome]